MCEGKRPCQNLAEPLCRLSMQLACGMQPETPPIAEIHDNGITSEHSSSSDGGTEDGPQASALIAVGMQMGWNIVRERDTDANGVVELSI